MEIIKGDLLQLAEEERFEIIVHGCNCFNTMGSGIAKQVREQYPNAYLVDCEGTRGDYNKLGNYTTCWADKFLIVNAYTQYGFNKSGESADVFEYASFELILQKLAYFHGHCNFGFPLIGMGLAGGDKDRILTLLEKFEKSIEPSGGTVTIVEYQPGK